MATRITLEGRSYLMDDLTLDEIVALEAELGTSWAFINALGSGAHCRAVLTALYARHRDPAEARKIVGALTTADALAMIVTDVAGDDRPDVHEDGIPVVGPKAAGPATT